MTSYHINRRQFLGGVTAAGLAGGPSCARAASPAPRVRALPLVDVRLLASPWLDAQQSNRRYLLSLDADRLLHNFRKLAGLAPKGDIYGGWESDTIAGHSLGHYLSAISLVYAQTGDEACLGRSAYIVEELGVVQRARGDGYVAGFTRKKADGQIEDGRIIFDEIEHGDIRSGGFDLNGAWSPLYNIHKTFAGLLDAHAYCANHEALGVAVRLAEFFERFYARLTEAQLQQVLLCEYGGLNESFSELGARTGDGRWIALARRTYDRHVLDPLTKDTDDLANRHANTQIPKLIGLARISELSEAPEMAGAASFFWERVVAHHSFVIGGNADREYFFDADTTSQHLTEQTCEHCNSYNMLKLTRHLYGWSPRAEYFDYYERTHLNHVLAAHDPSTGMFTYMTPMITGGAREWSTPTRDFWCCVGTGMESHAKHGDSIWWEVGDALRVNLYIPSTLHWRRRRMSFAMQTHYPYDGSVLLSVTQAARPQSFALSLRIPHWVSGAVSIAINGRTQDAVIADGYLTVSREWKTGDQLRLILPMALRIEAPHESARLISLARGPMLLAADLGPAEAPYDAIDPALVSGNVLDDMRPVPGAAVAFTTTQAGRPARLEFVPFFSQYRRRSALYLECFSVDEWRTEEARFVEQKRRERDIASRTVDVIHLGEMQQEHDHELAASDSWPVIYRGRNGRDVRHGGFVEFTLRVRPGALRLQTTMWESDVAKSRGYRILIDGVALTDPVIDGAVDHGFVDLSADIPPHLSEGRSQVRVRIEPGHERTYGPFFGVRILAGQNAPVQ